MANTKLSAALQRARTRKLEAIVAEHLPTIETLETRNSDSLDFHDVAVWGIKAALLAAYEAGLEAAQNPED